MSVTIKGNLGDAFDGMVKRYAEYVSKNWGKRVNDIIGTTAVSKFMIDKGPNFTGRNTGNILYSRSGRHASAVGSSRQATGGNNGGWFKSEAISPTKMKVTKSARAVDPDTGFAYSRLVEEGGFVRPHQRRMTHIYGKRLDEPINVNVKGYYVKGRPTMKRAMFTEAKRITKAMQSITEKAFDKFFKL